MSEKTILRAANVIMYVVMFSVLIAMLHNAWYNKNLNVTTPCSLDQSMENEPRPVWEILGYTDEPKGITQEREEIDEYERLMQSCLSWQHNYNFLNWRIMPAIGMLFVVMLMKSSPKFFSDLPKRIIKVAREQDNEGKNNKPPNFGFNK